MNYFISRDGQTYGPYTLSDLQRYVASGNILVTDQARSEAMGEWVPVSQVIGNIPVPVTSPVGPPEPMLRREGNRLVVIRDAVLPPYCVKCAQPAEGEPWNKNFSWCNPWLGLLVLLGLIGIIVYVIIYNAKRKQMQLAIPLCEHHRQTRRTNLTLGIVLLAASPLFLIFSAITHRSEMAGAGALIFFVMLLAGVIVLSRAAPLRPTKIDERQGIFSGAGEPFLRIVESQSLRAGAGH